MLKKLLLFKLLTLFVCAHAQETTSVAHNYTMFLCLPMGERPQIKFESVKGQGGAVAVGPAQMDPNRTPPKMVYYKIKESAEGKQNSESDYKGFFLGGVNEATQWHVVKPRKSSIDLSLGQTSAEGTTSYTPYIKLNFPEQSRGGIVAFCQQNSKNWANPKQYVIPIETIMDPAGTVKSGILIINTLPMPMAYKVGTSVGRIQAGGHEFVQIPPSTTSVIPYEVQISKEGKWEKLTGSQLQTSSNSIICMFTYVNLHNKSKPREGTSFTYIQRPEIPVEKDAKSTANGR